MSNFYHIIFSGEVAEGFEISEVKEKLTVMLKEDSETIEKLFSGKRHIIKKDADQQKCKKIQDVLLKVGAVCYIEETEDASNQEITNPTEATEQTPAQSEMSDTTPLPGSETKKFDTIKEAIKTKLSQLLASTRSSLNIVQKKSAVLWAEGSESIKSDIEVGGIKSLVKNRYFLSSLGISCALLILLIGAFSYQRDTMPLTEKNFNQVLAHVEFIKKAFTPDELDKMRENPDDFLDYLFVDPIKKMGYQFEASIDEITTSFLSNNLPSKKMALAGSYLEVLARDRDLLFKSGYISEGVKDKLEMVSNKMGL